MRKTRPVKFSINGQLNRTWASLGGDPLGMPMVGYFDGIRMGKPILIMDLAILWEVHPNCINGHRENSAVCVHVSEHGQYEQLLQAPAASAPRRE